MSKGIELKVYGYDDWTTQIGTLRGRKDPEYLEELKGVGGGSFKINRNNKQIVDNPALIAGRNVIKYCVDDEVVGAIMLSEDEAVTIATNEAGGEEYTIVGQGLKSWFDDAIVRPYKGFKSTSKDTRAFSFAAQEAPWYVSSEWITPFNAAKVRSKAWWYGPDKWPDEAKNAYWIWGTANATVYSGAPAGENYFRVTLPVATDGTYSIYIAAADVYTVYVDGEELAASDPLGGAHAEANRLNVDLDAGTHIIGVKATNLRSAAGLALAVFRTIEQVPEVNMGGATISIGTDATVTRSGHGLGTGTKVYFTSTGALPGGLSPNTDYWVVNPTANTFKLARSNGGPPIDTSGSQSGIHTLWKQALAERQTLVTYSGMSVSALNAALTAANSVVALRLASYNALPSGDSGGNNTQRKQAAKKKTAYANYRKAVQDRNAIEKERNIAQNAVDDGVKWRVNPYPAEAPGWTPGQILLTLLSEAEARGIRFASLLNPTFTDEEDSNGTPWGEVVEWTFDIGESLMAVVNKLEELICDIWIDPDTYDLNIVLERGVDRTDYVKDVDNITVLESPVIFNKGKNLKEARIKSRSKVKNTIAVKTAKGWMPVTQYSSTSVAKYGVLESTIDTAASERVSIMLARQILKERALTEEGASYAFTVRPTDKKPWKNYNPGDLVLAPDKVGIRTPRRLMSLALQEGPSGNPLYTAEFDIVFLSPERRIAGVVNKLSGGGAGATYGNNGGTGANSPSQPIKLPPPTWVPADTLLLAPTDLEAFSIGEWSADGVNAVSRVELTWEPVTENTDGSEAVPSFYEVWGYPNVEGGIDSDAMLAASGEPKATMTGFTPGVEWAFRVIAWGQNQRASEASEELLHTPGGPIEAMDPPSTPSVTSAMGNVIITWDGLLGTNPPPPQFRYVWAEVSPDGVTGWVRRGPTLAREGRQIQIVGEAIGSTVYVRLNAIDGAGIASGSSGIASTVVTGIDLGDLDESVGEAIEAAEEAALAAREQSNMLSDNSFELNDNTFWTLGSGVTNVTTDPHTGLRHLRVPASGVAHEAFRYNRVIPCQPGDNYYLRVYVNPNGTVPDDGLSLGFEYGADESLGTLVQPIPSGPLSGSDYVMVGGSWQVPAGVNFFSPRVQVLDTSGTSVYFIDDIRMLKMTGPEELVAGAVTADKIAANSIVAEHMQANSVAAASIQAGAIVAEKLATDSVTSNAIASDTILSNHLTSGAVQTNHLSPAVGGELNLEANTSIQFVVGEIGNVQENLDTTNANLEEMQTYYNFGSDGAIISKPGSVFALALRNDTIEMLENGHSVSYWNSGQMYVDQLVAEKLTMGNHQIEKYGDGTVVRDL